MTENSLLVVVAVVIALFSEFAAKPLAAKLGMKVKSHTLARRLLIEFPVGAFIMWAILYIVYVQYFLKHP